MVDQPKVRVDIPTWLLFVWTVAGASAAVAAWTIAYAAWQFADAMSAAPGVGR